MKQQELVKGLTYLGVAYSKEFTKDECQIYYDFLKEYNYEVFVKAIKEIIKTSKFIPKITEIIDYCEKAKETINYGILDLMKLNGYFKDQREYDKACMFLQKGVIPNWLKEDMKKYGYKEELEKRNDIKFIENN